MRQAIVVWCAFFLFVASFSAIYISFKPSIPQIMRAVARGFFFLASLLLFLWKEFEPFTMIKTADLSTVNHGAGALLTASGHHTPTATERSKQTTFALAERAVEVNWVLCKGLIARYLTQLLRRFPYSVAIAALGARHGVSPFQFR
jgi:hypothetical protein